MAIPTSLVLQSSYRHIGPEAFDRARAYLQDAVEALNMALLTLEGSPDDSRESKLRRAANARRFLADAASDLARARVFVPGIHTYAINVVTTTEPDVERELNRLHELTTKLLWRNHNVLPARVAAEPLAPEDEAQLAAVVRDLATQARINQAMRHKWFAAATVFGLLAPVLGVALYVLAAASMTLAAVELARGSVPVLT